MFLDQRLLALRGNRHRFTPYLLNVEPPDDPEAVGRGFDQRDRTSVLSRKSKPRWRPHQSTTLMGARRGETGKSLPMTEQLSLAGGDGEGRDVVQRRG